jgi:uncharacterized repeat protein (TIGR03837 family)
MRVFVDDLPTFKVVCNEINPQQSIQQHENITWIDMSKLDDPMMDRLGVAELVFETFACEIPSVYMKRAYYQSTLLINLEHLSAEDWVEGYHCKESLLPQGTLKKFYFMPGFTENTGGIIPNMFAPINMNGPEKRLAMIRSLIPAAYGGLLSLKEGLLFGSIFTYVRNMDRLLDDCITLEKPLLLLLFGEKTKKSFQYSLKNRNIISNIPGKTIIQNCTIIEMPFLVQEAYDRLLQLMDFNIVRGEDSLTRAVLSGKPFIWNAYIQDNSYQIVKVDALCSTMKRWFSNNHDFDEYQKLMVAFNSASRESYDQHIDGSFLYFLQNLKKFEHSIIDMSYFMTRNCDLIKKITTFISDYPYIKG